MEYVGIDLMIAVNICFFYDVLLDFDVIKCFWGEFVVIIAKQPKPFQ